MLVSSYLWIVLEEEKAIKIINKKTQHCLHFKSLNHPLYKIWQGLVALNPS